MRVLAQGSLILRARRHQIDCMTLLASVPNKKRR